MAKSHVPNINVNNRIHTKRVGYGIISRSWWTFAEFWIRFRIQVECVQVSQSTTPPNLSYLRSFLDFKIIRCEYDIARQRIGEGTYWYKIKTKGWDMENRVKSYRRTQTHCAYLRNGCSCTIREAFWIGDEELKRDRLQNTWWVAPVSKSQTASGMDILVVKGRYRVVPENGGERVGGGGYCGAAEGEER